MKTDKKSEHVDVKRIAGKVSGAVAIATVSHEDESETDWSKFDEFHAFLKENFPLVHENLTLEQVGKASLMFYWKGTDESLDPIAFLGHQDVVPIAEGTEEDWEHPPFSGYNDGKYIWGRGSLDMKNHLICMMEAMELLLEEGYTPKRGIYLLLGHNEEIVAGSTNGARDMAALLKERGVHLDSLIDEGGAMMAVKGPMGLGFSFGGVGVSEKGYADVKVTVDGTGGHSSRPPKHTAVGLLADKVHNLEANPMEPHMTETLRGLLLALSDALPLGLGVFPKLILKAPKLLTTVMAADVTGAAFVRTTHAVTMCEGSPAANVLPTSANCTINFRIIQGDTVDDVLKHVEKCMGGKGTKIELVKGKEASITSPTDSRAYQTLKKTAQLYDKKNLIAPYLLVAGTDAEHYEVVCENIYRFSPFSVPINLMLTTHSTNEHCPVDQLEQAVTFFKRYTRAMTEE